MSGALSTALVLIWLAAGAFLALVVPFRAAAWLVVAIRRSGHLWLGAALLCVLSDQIEPLDGWNDPNDPLAIVPRLVKLGWFAGLFVGLPGRIRWLAQPVLLAAHVSAIAFLVRDGTEALLYTTRELRDAWLGDKLTHFLVLLAPAWDALWDGARPFPTALAAELLGPLARVLIPGAWLAVVGFGLVLHRSVASLTPGAEPLGPTLGRPLGVVPMALALAWVLLGSLVADGPVALVLDDLAWLVIVTHSVGTVATLWRRPEARSGVVFGLAMATVALDWVLLLGGAMGVALRAGERLGAWPRALPSFGSRLERVASVTAVLVAAIVYAVLRDTEIRIVNPDEGTAIVVVDRRAMTDVPTIAHARQRCRVTGGAVCRPAEWRLGLVGAGKRLDAGNEVTTWEHIELRLGRTTVDGALFPVTTPDGQLLPLTLVTPLAERAGVTPQAARCCRPRTAQVR